MKKAKKIVLLTALLIFAVGVSATFAWGGLAHRKITSDAYFIMPEQFRQFLGESLAANTPEKSKEPHLKALLEAALEPDRVLKDFRNHVFHIQGYDLGNGPFHVSDLAKEITEDIKNKAPISKIVQKLGWIAHYVADLHQPLHTGVETWDGIEEKAYHAGYEKDMDKKVYTYGVYYDGAQATDRISARMVYEALCANQYYTAIETAYTNGSRYENVKVLSSKCYSRAVNTLVDVWYSIWAAAGGKVNPAKDGKPKYYPPFWRKDISKSAVEYSE